VPSLEIGEKVPGFTLPATDGRSVEFVPGGGPAVVVFTCNHCPYALAWHGRLNEVARDYMGKGVQFLQVNANDVNRSPGDSLPAMTVRVEAGEFAGPYLYDEKQEVAHAFGAKVTPDVFIIDADGTLAYRGAPDEDYDDPRLNAQWARDALDAVLAGSQVGLAATTPVGCTIKWSA
jgi:peroxiredoxin